MKRIGIATWAFTGITLRENLRRVSDMGYTAASLIGNCLDNTTPNDLSEAEEVIRDRSIAITIHSNFGIRETDDHDMIERLNRILDWHDRIGCLVNVSYDMPAAMDSSGKACIDYDKIKDLFGKALETSRGRGVYLLLEDCPLTADQLGHLEEWRERYPHWGILVDLGHMNLRLRRTLGHAPSAEAMREYLHEIPLPIRELHIHGNDGEKDQHLPPYMGNADIAEYKKVLDSLDFDGVAVIEAMPWWCDGNQAQMIRDAQDSLQFWANLG